MIAGMYYGDAGYCSTSIGSLRNDHCTSGHSIGRPILICLSSASHQRAQFSSTINGFRRSALFIYLGLRYHLPPPDASTTTLLARPYLYLVALC